MNVNFELHGDGTATLTLTIGPVSALELSDALLYVATDAFIEELAEAITGASA